MRARWKTALLAVSVTLTSMVSFHVTPAAAAATVLADTYTDAANPQTNFGSKMYLKVDNSPVQRAYLKFDVSGYTAGTTASLQFYVESANKAGLQVRDVTDDSWLETTLTDTNAPPVGAVVHSTGALTAGEWVSVDVSSSITGDGPVSFAITTTSSTATKITSREGTNAPRLLVPAPANASPFTVTRTGPTTYQAASSSNGSTYTGSLKTVVEGAAAELEATGGGTIRFAAGDFDLGTQHFEFYSVTDLTFAGAGMGSTTIMNNTSEATDTEPFDFSGAFGITIRDLTVSAGGPARTTSDALDFDQGNDVLVENVRVTASRGRGIVFDGKNAGWNSLRNTVRGCVVENVPGSGIELLASSENLIEGCTISGVGRHGIVVNKSSTSAGQPNKPSSDNTIRNNTINESGQDGVSVNGGARNTITGNTVTNSADDTAGRDGIRIGASDSQTCNDNVVSGNTATDNQATKTQRYGLNIALAACARTVVGPGNDFEGNRVKAVNDLGTDTVYVN